MCGIAGLCAPASADRADTLRRMCGALRHRGPDAEGLYEGSACALGMRRLSIIDVDGGAQPVHSEDGRISVVFNGEIYNYRELQSVLRSRGHRLASESDSEVLPHLYEEYGTAFVEHLRGMFAIALWDDREQRLVLARDRLGKKPLYYRDGAAGVVAFASELKALLADPDTGRDVDLEAISHYLTYQYVPAPFSALSAVRKLEPGSVLIHDRRGTRTSRYWNLSFAAASTASPADEDELAEELRERLLDCVRVRLMSERPLGAFLSGGLDSSAIVAAMSRVSSTTPKTFSIGFDDDAYNELPYARQVAEIYGTDHHELVVRPDVQDVLPLLARAFDEPFADSSAIPSYHLARLTRGQVVVALNGDGGDEAFGGYLRYPAFLRLADRRVPGGRAVAAAGHALSRNAGRSTRLRRVGRAAMIAGDPDVASRYGRLVSYFLPEEKRTLLRRDVYPRSATDHAMAPLHRSWRRHAAADPVNQVLAADTATYLPGDLLAKVDITTMAVSLEARSPLLDHTLIEWAASLPGTLKVRGGETKYLLKKALAPWLPDELIHRRKQGFGVPLDAWLRGPLQGMVRDLLADPAAGINDYCEPTAVRRLIEEHMSGTDRGSQLYALLMLELWHREVLHAPVGADNVG